MNLAFDIDGVVLNSIKDILEHINKTTNKNIHPDDLKKWDLDALGVDREIIFDAVRYMCSKSNINPYSNAEKVLSKIHKQTKQPLLFITGRKDLDSANKHLSALNWNPTIPKIKIIGGKRNKLQYLAKYNVEFILEDDDKYVEEYKNYGIQTGLMERPWNKNTNQPIAKMFKSWNEVYNWFNNGKS